MLNSLSIQFMIIVTLFAFLGDLLQRAILRFDPKRLTDYETDRLKILSAKIPSDLSELEEKEFIELQMKSIPGKLVNIGTSYWLFTKMREILFQKTSNGIWTLVIFYGLFRLIMSKINGLVIDTVVNLIGR